MFQTKIFLKSPKFSPGVPTEPAGFRDSEKEVPWGASYHLADTRGFGSISLVGSLIHQASVCCIKSLSNTSSDNCLTVKVKLFQFQFSLNT